MYGPSDMYGDMNLEDIDEFEGLQSDDGREINPGSKFQRDEFRTFDKDFEEEWDDGRYLPDDYDEACSAQWEEDPDDFEQDQELMDLYGPED